MSPSKEKKRIFFLSGNVSISCFIKTVFPVLRKPVIARICFLGRNLIKESKYELETLLLSKFSVLADKCLKLQEQLNSDVDLLKETNDNTRAMLLNKINKLIENYGVIHKTHYENFKSLLSLVNELKAGVLVLDFEMNQNMN